MEAADGPLGLFHRRCATTTVTAATAATAALSAVSALSTAAVDTADAADGRRWHTALSAELRSALPAPESTLSGAAQRTDAAAAEPPLCSGSERPSAAATFAFSASLPSSAAACAISGSALINVAWALRAQACF